MQTTFNFEPSKLQKAINEYASGASAKPLAVKYGIPYTNLRRALRAAGVYRGMMPPWNKGGRLEHLHPKVMAQNARKRLQALWNKRDEIVFSAFVSEWKTAKRHDHLWTRHPCVSAYKSSLYYKTEHGLEKVRQLYRKNRLQKTNYHFSRLLRTRIYNVLKGHKKSASTEELLGCSITQLKAHLQSKFTNGMTWNNYGSHWHIDHIRPCASFDLSSPEQQRMCFHWSNLQPLTAFENRSKNSRWNGVRHATRCQ